MALETASWITELVTTNPVAGDPVGEGDDHLRMLKTVLQNSFPSSSTAAVIPNMSGNGGSILITDGTDSAWSSVAYIDTANSRVGIGTTSPTATLDVDGSATFNDSGAAVDFRIESDTNANMFFVDGTNSRVGIGTSAPTTIFEIYSSWGRLKIFSPSYSTVGYDLVTSGGTGTIELTKPQGYNLHLFTSNNIALMPTKKCVGINQNLPTSHLQIDGDDTANAWGTDGIILRSSAATITDDSTAASGTAASAVFNSFGQPTLAATNASVTTTDAATVYIANAPTAGTNQTITNPYALWVDAGETRFDGDVGIDGNTFYVDSVNNRVGVGTTVPSTKFEVVGAVKFDGNTFYVDAANSRVGIGTTVPSLKFEVVGAVKFSQDFTVDTNTLHVDSANNRVGIGTTTPGALLDVNGGDALIHTLTVGLGAGSISTNTAVGKDALYSNTTSSRNTAVGYESLKLTTGGNNTALGANALAQNTTGSENTAIGDTPLYNNVTGIRNTAVGYYSLLDNTTSDNTAVGHNSLKQTTTGTRNVAVGSASGQVGTTGQHNSYLGYAAGYANSTGSYNTGIGYEALNQNTAADNTAVGYSALRSNTTGTPNIAVGKDALYTNTTAADNIAIGNRALYSSNSSGNVAIGDQALEDLTTGSSNIAIGVSSQLENTTGINNVSMGLGSLQKNTTGGRNVAIGFYAQWDGSGQIGNVAVGEGSLQYATLGANYNVGVGYQAGEQVTDGAGNALLGWSAGTEITTGDYNVAIGTSALGSQTTPTGNIGIGRSAATTNLTSSGIVAIGEYALQYNTANYNTSVGNQALRYNSTGTPNVALGYQALYNNETGDNNVAMGHQALLNSGKVQTAGSFETNISYTIKSTGTTDFTLIGAADSNPGTVFTATGAGTGTGTATPNTDSNTAVGWKAGDSITTGSNLTVIGYDAEPSSATATNEITLGDANVTDFRLPGPDIFSSSTETVFNESGADKDFRVEGDTDANLFFVDASADRVGIGTATPSTKLHIQNTSTTQSPLADTFLTVENNSAAHIQILSSDSQYGALVFGSASNNKVGSINYYYNGGAPYARIYVNNSEKIRIQNDGNVGIGNSSPGAKLDVDGSAIFNESGAAVDFRIEGDTEPNLFFVDGSTDKVGIGTDSPDSELEVLSTNGVDVSRGILSSQYNTGQQGAVLTLKKARGTSASPTTVVNGDYISTIYFNGYGTQFGTRAQISAYVASAPSGNSVPTALLFSSGDGATTAERFRLNSNGNIIVNNPQNSVDFIVKGDNDGALIYADGSTDRVGIGTSSPAKTLDVSGEIRASTGILFGTDTAAANTLDDYEEGTFTPGISFGGGSTGITYGTQSGRYTKIGNMVFCTVHVTLTNKGTDTGNAAITGLPFTVGNYLVNTGNEGSGSVAFFANGNNTNDVQAVAYEGTTTILFYDGQASVQATDADFNNTTSIKGLTISYPV